MEIPIRRAVIGDAPQLGKLLQRIGWFEAFRSRDLKDSIAQVESRLRQCLADTSHAVYIAEWHQGEIAGYASVH